MSKPKNVLLSLMEASCDSDLSIHRLSTVLHHNHYLKHLSISISIWKWYLSPHLCELRSLGGGDVEAQVLGHPPQGLGGREHVGPVGPTAVLWTRVVSWALLEG